jgi:hypothetical protein
LEASPSGNQREKSSVKLLGWILWVVGLVLGLSFAYGVRTYVRTGQGVQQATVNQTMLILAAVVAVPLLGFSPFHLLWLLPVAFIVGMLSLIFPFSLVSLVGRPFGRICCLGLDRAEVARNTERVRRFQELIASGMSPEEAKEQLERN